MRDRCRGAATAHLCREESRGEDGSVDRRLASARPLPRATPQLNDLLARLEQRLLDERAPAADRWYRHVVFGWDIYSLYDGQPFPGVAKALREGHLGVARAELAGITARIGRVAADLDEATRLTR
jgi:hypothetical protein